ncbi:erythromycin esterase, partial [Aneurinibacillus migulanus]
MKITKLLTRIIAVGLGTSLLFASTNISAATTQSTWLKQNAKEIKSLTSEDYSDLAFLKPLLKDKTVVSLGENFHRVAEYSSVKTRLIKYLHEELGFDVIAFESGLGDSAAIYENADSLTAKQMMGGSIFPIWHSKETLELFDYIKQQRKTNKPLYLAGYDMQFTSGYLTQFIAAWISKLDKEYGKQYFDFEMQGMTELYAVMNKYGAFSDKSPQYKAELRKVIDKYEPKYKNLIQFIKDNRTQLAAAYPDNPHMVDIAIKSLGDRIKFMEMCLYDEKE